MLRDEHRRDKTHLQKLKEILNILKSGNFPPHTPPEKNHKLVGLGKNVYGVHISGNNKVVLKYSVDAEANELQLWAIGNHDAY